MAEKVTNFEYVNLFQTEKPGGGPYIFASRKEDPFADTSPDAIVIASYIWDSVAQKHKIVVTREFRPPINDWELGFPAGLIDPGEEPIDAAKRELKEETGLDLHHTYYFSPQIYSSSGATDESVIMFFVIATGTVSTDNVENDERIEVLVVDQAELRKLLRSGMKIGAKAWPIMDHFSRTGLLW